MTGKPNEVMARLIAAAEAAGLGPSSVAPAPPPAAAVESAPEPPYRIRAKAGPLRNGAERGGGTVWHAVTGDHADGGAALCGARPAIMWSSWTPKDARIGCARCARLVAERFPEAG
jgi:hypothetical protein